MTPAFRYTLLWIVGSLLLVGAALTMLPGAYLDGHYVPATPDAFYHARRILDSVASGAPVIQFDSRIHFPEGSWLPWPWGFDAGLAAVVRLFGPFRTEAEAAGLLLNFSVAGAPLAVALLLVLARQLNLALLPTLLLTLTFAALPLVFLLFAVGNIDHHFAELIYILMTLCAGMWFFRSRAELAPGLALGAVLGSAVAIHNGLFILQIPVVGSLAWRWLSGQSLPSPRCVQTFGATLVLTTLVACAGSVPWREGFFEFYTLSWFHLYVAGCTALLAVLFGSLERRPSRIAWLGVVAALAAVPVLGIANLGARFVGGEADYLQGVTEAMSPYELYALFGPAQSTSLLSWLMWLMVPALLINAFWLVRTQEPGRQYFAFGSLFFLALLQMQYRFGVFGVVPLLATWAMVLDLARKRWPKSATLQGFGGVAAAALVLIPTQSVWTNSRAPGGDPLYADIQPALAILGDACERRPGVVLTPLNDGHWVHFHTKCSVIGNVFLLTEQQAKKRREVEALLQGDPVRLPLDRPEIAYVLVHRELELFVQIGPDGAQRGVVRLSQTPPPLVERLLGPEDALPTGYRVLWAASGPDGQLFGRLLELNPVAID